MTRQRKDKAGDVFAQAQWLLGPLTNFAAAFPTVKTATVTVEEKDDDGEVVRVEPFTESTIGEYVNCSNPACYGGGVQVGSLLRRMVEAGETEAMKAQSCQGHEGTKTRQGRPCLYRFTVHAQVKYRS